MKTKLLRKLRKRVVIYERNGLYRAHEYMPFFGSRWEDDNNLLIHQWSSKENAIKDRRECILKKARNGYFKSKSIIK